MALVTPKPVLVRDELKHIGCGLRFAENPSQFFAELRAQYGDTFLVDVFGYKLFCVFSPVGLKNFYQLPESHASFGMATFDLMSFKTPIEVFMDTDIHLFYELLAVKKLRTYLADIDQVLEAHLDSWGVSGEIDVFDTIRTLEQRIGFGLWIGNEASKDGVWQQLKQHFDVLAQEFAFVSPEKTLATIKGNKVAEREALAALQKSIAGFWRAREAEGIAGQRGDTLDFLYQRYADEVAGEISADELDRKVAHNIINANQGFLSNLYAAIAWVLLRLQRHPDVRAKVVAEIEATRSQYGENFCSDLNALNSMQYLEQVLMESVRMAQRSITLRKVMLDTEIDVGSEVYTVSPGVYLTTMLSVTNTESGPLQDFDPEHYQGNKLRKEYHGEAQESVSTFGHGEHACPAQRFSHSMCKIVMTRLLSRFEFSSLESVPDVASRQMGGVARSESACYLRYTAR